MEIKSNEPRLTQKQICNQLGYSDITIKRYRDDINMDIPYIRNKYKKRTTKRKPSTITEKHSKNENSKSITNKKSRNNVIKASDPNNISGKELNEQAFSNSFVENNQEDNTKFITLARKMIDSS